MPTPPNRPLVTPCGPHASRGLYVRWHPDKTFINRIEKGFDVLRCDFSCAASTPSIFRLRFNSISRFDVVRKCGFAPRRYTLGRSGDQARDIEFIANISDSGTVTWFNDDKTSESPLAGAVDVAASRQRLPVRLDPVMEVKQRGGAGTVGFKLVVPIAII